MNKDQVRKLKLEALREEIQKGIDDLEAERFATEGKLWQNSRNV